MRSEPSRPDGASSLTSYAELERHVQAFARGAFNLLILLGAPGLAKSRLVRDLKQEVRPKVELPECQWRS